MLKVGLTGGIGSGKSIVRKVFNLLEIPTIDADQVAKQLLVEDRNIQSQLIAVFGDQAYVNEQYNSAWIAKQVFNQPHLREQLNEIVHPPTIEYINSWIRNKENEGHNYIVKEAAIMIETGSYQEMDLIIGVQAPKELRIRRVMDRNQMLREDVLKIMSSQWSEEKKRTFYDFIIENNEEQSVLSQVLEVHYKLLALNLKENEGN